MTNNNMSNNSNNNNNNIEVKDRNSKIISLIPSHLQEPLILIAKIKGFKSVDNYIVELVKDDLESIREGGQGVKDIGEYVIKYLEKNTDLEKTSLSTSSSSSPSSPTSSTNTTNTNISSDDNDDEEEDDEDDDEEKELIPVTLKLNKNFTQVGKLVAKHYEEDFDTFVSEEIKRVILSIAESPITVLTPPPISDELKQHIQKLLMKERKRTK